MVENSMVKVDVSLLSRHWHFCGTALIPSLISIICNDLPHSVRHSGWAYFLRLSASHPDEEKISPFLTSGRRRKTFIDVNFPNLACLFHLSFLHLTPPYKLTHWTLDSCVIFHFDRVSFKFRRTGNFRRYFITNHWRSILARCSISRLR